MRSGLVLPFHRPSPVTAHPAGALDRWLGRKLQATLARANIRLELWDGTTGDLPGPAIADLIVLDRRVLVGLIVNPDLYFGEGYETERVLVRGDLGRLVDALRRMRHLVARPRAATPPGLRVQEIHREGA